MEPFTHEIRFHVRYAETDAMGIVHHSSYIVWFEEGRSSYMRAIGFPYAEVEKAGYYFTVTEVHARYLAPAKYDEEISLFTRVGELKSRGLRFEYEVRRAADGQLLVSGYTEHICIDHAGAVRRIPAEIMAHFRREKR